MPVLLAASVLLIALGVLNPRLILFGLGGLLIGGLAASPLPGWVWSNPWTIVVALVLVFAAGGILLTGLSAQYRIDIPEYVSGRYRGSFRAAERSALEGSHQYILSSVSSSKDRKAAAEGLSNAGWTLTATLDGAPIYALDVRTDLQISRWPLSTAAPLTVPAVTLNAARRARYLVPDDQSEMRLDVPKYTLLETFPGGRTESTPQGRESWIVPLRGVPGPATQIHLKLASPLVRSTVLHRLVGVSLNTVTGWVVLFLGGVLGSQAQDAVKSLIQEVLSIVGWIA